MNAIGLQQRLRNSAHGSRDLDADMFEAFSYEVVRQRVKPRGIAWRYKTRNLWVALPAITSSIDWAIYFVNTEMRKPDIYLRRHSHEWSAEVGWSGSHKHGDPAIAICLAMLAYANNATVEATDGR